jgi:peptide/nickel transport system substrate-binding protein
MNRRFGVLALFLLVAACSRSGAPQSGGATGPANYGESQPAPGAARQNSWTRPHVLRLTSSEDISTLNPTLNTQGVLMYLSQMTMAWLIRWDHGNNPVPELATAVPTMQNGGVSKDGLTITYHIRKGVKWSDGVPFDADDVVFSFHAILNPANNITSRTGWDRIASIDEPDKYTVVLHLTKPYSPFLETFFSTAGANPCLMPKHILGGLPNINNAPYNALPVGIGPFKYKKWDRSARVVMVANPLYWRGSPKLQEIDYEIIPDLNTSLTEIQAKGLDLWYPVPASMFASKMQQLSQFAYIAQPGFLFNHMDFNVTRPALREAAVRQALRYATDRSTFINKISHGIGNLQEQPAPKTSAYWIKGVAITPFDLAKANQILEGAGWKRGADGIRVKNGVRLSLEFITNTGNPVADQVIELTRSWWKQIGVDVTAKHYNSALLFASYADNGPLYRGNWDVAFFAWGLDAIGDFSNLYACDQMPPSGQNILHWCNKRADKAMHDFYTHYDQLQRNKDDAVVVEELNKDVPMIVQNGRVDIFFFNRDLRNFHPNGVSPFDDMMTVDI